MWSMLISRNSSASSTNRRAAVSEIRLPSRKAVFSISLTGSSSRPTSAATRSNPNPPTTVISSAPAACANDPACASSGRPPTSISALGICCVNVPRRLPSPAASSTACIANRLEQGGQRREPANHRHRREAQREAVGRERRRHADEGNALALRDLAVVQRVADEQHLLSGGADLTRRRVQGRAPLGQPAAVTEHEVEPEPGGARER